MKKRILSLVLALALVMSVAIVPAFAVSTGNLTKQRETEHFEFYCTDQDVKALDDLVKSFEGCYDRVTTDLGKAPSGKTKVNIYPDIQSFHSAMGRPNDPDWSVGEAKNGAIYMTSPLNPGPAHSCDDIIQIAIHEFTHIVINLFGDVPIYLHEGVACYEARQYQYKDLSAFITSQMKQNKVPSMLPTNGQRPKSPARCARASSPPTCKTITAMRSLVSSSAGWRSCTWSMQPERTFKRSCQNET